MAYAHLTAPIIGEEPRRHMARKRDLDAILARAGSQKASRQQEDMSTLGLKSLFGMETAE